MSSQHPLVLSLLELDSAIRCLMTKVGSRSEHVRIREALTDVHAHANEVVVRDVAQGHGDLTIKVFEEVVKRAHEAGLQYPDMVAAFHRAQGSE